jgi:hypothetical protein
VLEEAQAIGRAEAETGATGASGGGHIKGMWPQTEQSRRMASAGFVMAAVIAGVM